MKAENALYVLEDLDKGLLTVVYSKDYYKSESSSRPKYDYVPMLDSWLSVQKCTKG